MGCTAGAPAALAATTSIGESSLTPGFAPPVVSAGQDIPVFQGAAGAGYVARSPVSGTITSWSFLSAGIATGKHFLLRVLEPVGTEAKTWRAASASAEVAVGSATGVDAVNGPFATSLPVAAGDAIALQPTDNTSVPTEEGAAGVDGIRYFLAPFADGATAPLTPGSEANNGQLVPVQATVTYTTPGESPVPGPTPPITAPVNLAPPSVSGSTQGTVRAGQTLQCVAGSWSGSPTVAIGWFSQAPTPGHPPQLSGVRPLGHGPTLKLPSLPPGRQLYCQATASAGGTSSTATSAPLLIGAVKPALARQLGGRLGAAPRVVRGVAPGNLESCSTGIWQNYPRSFSYQWLLRSSRGSAARLTNRIVGRRPTLRVRPSFGGSVLRCRITAVNEAGRVSVSSAPVVVPKALEGLISVTCGSHVSAKNVDEGCPGTGINVIVPGQPAGHSLNPTSTAANPLLTSAHMPGVPGTGHYILECEPPKFNRQVTVTYKWSLAQIEFFTYELKPQFVPEGFVGSYRALSGHFLTIDHGLLAPKREFDLYYVGWREATSSDSGHQLEHLYQFGPGALRVTCEAIGSAGHTSDWGRSPALYVERTPGFFNEDSGVVDYFEEE
jgi:hypothetical protein